MATRSILDISSKGAIEVCLILARTLVRLLQQRLTATRNLSETDQTELVFSQITKLFKMNSEMMQ